MRKLAAISLLLAAPAAAQTPGFWLVGTASGTDRSVTSALSQNGAIAGGLSSAGPPTYQSPGFLWTESAGRTDLSGPQFPLQCPIYGLSSDGSTLVGYTAGITTPARAFRRTGSGPLQDLGAAGYQESYGRAVSGDGSVVVGHLSSVIGTTPIGQAFRWTQQGGMQPLGYLRPLSPDSQANAVSRDGTTIVGDSQSGADEAFVWRESAGMQPLPPIAPGAGSSARAVNADGSVVAGDAGSFAARWTSSGVQSLGTLPGALFSIAMAMNDVGDLLGGSASGGSVPQTAVVWTSPTGMVTLSGYLSGFGIATPQGWRLQDVFAISGDGRTFAGDAISSAGQIQGFVATIPAPGGAAVLVMSALVFSRRHRATRGTLGSL